MQTTTTTKITTPAVTVGTGSLQISRQTISKSIVTPAVSSTATGTKDSNPSETLHTVLDAIGFVPGVGDLADLVNMVAYAVEGDWTNAGISAVAMVPGCDIASGSRLAGKAVKTLGETALGTAILALAKNSNKKVANEATEKAAKEAVEKLSAEGTEGAVDKLKRKIKKLFGVDGTVPINPNEIRLSQSSVNGSAEIVESMKRNGWVGDPVDVVQMPDGVYTTIDNTRVVAARQAGIDVQANIHAYDELLPQEYIDRFTTKKGVPVTWGDAISLRIGK